MKYFSMIVMLTIILQYTAGFIDSYEEHTESVQTDKKVKYIGEQLHEPLIVEHEPHHYLNPTGKLNL